MKTSVHRRGGRGRSGEVAKSKEKGGEEWMGGAGETHFACFTPGSAPVGRSTRPLPVAARYRDPPPISKDELAFLLFFFFSTGNYLLLAFFALYGELRAIRKSYLDKRFVYIYE